MNEDEHTYVQQMKNMCHKVIINEQLEVGCTNTGKCFSIVKYIFSGNLKHLVD